MSELRKNSVLELDQLSVTFVGEDKETPALSDVSISAQPGEIVGLVGESGSGKSVTAMTIMRLLPESARISGHVRLLGQDILTMDMASLRKMRGRDVSYIFQEPLSALNPTKRIGAQLIDVIRRHTLHSNAEARAKSESLLRDMRIVDPRRVMHSYPFELSGGMRQRVLIAMAFSCNPRIIIADEPTTALDVSVQAQVLALLLQKAHETSATVVFISHDLALVSQICSRIYVMRNGRVLEEGLTQQVIGNPTHPYTKALLDALPERGRPRTPLPTALEQGLSVDK